MNPNLEKGILQDFLDCDQLQLKPELILNDGSNQRFSKTDCNLFTRDRIKSVNPLAHIIKNKKSLSKVIRPSNSTLKDNNFSTGDRQLFSSTGILMGKRITCVQRLVDFLCPLLLCALQPQFQQWQYDKFRIVIYRSEVWYQNRVGNNIEMQNGLKSHSIIMDYCSNYDDKLSLDNIPVFVLEFGKRDNDLVAPSTSGSDQKSGSHYDVPESPSISLTDSVVYNSDIGVGSMVEVIADANLYYGVVRWIGFVDDAIYAGIELEEEQHGLTDGTYCGERFFSCPPGRGLFVPLALCRKDGRFQDVPHTPQPDTSSAEFGQVECPIVPGCIAPLNHTTDLEGLCGKFRGIQGHHNSCYLDATLFSMFTFTSIFDSLLFRPREAQDSVHYEEVQRVLREEIVNPLRQNLYVRADRVMKLRKLLEKLSSISGLTSEEKDPEEFLNSLVAQILRAEPFLKLNSGQEAFHYQLFVEKDEKLVLPSVQQLFEQSFLTSNIKLKEVPPCLIIQMPRFGKSYKMYPRILPSQLLDVTDVIEDAPRQCTVCGKLAAFECRECFGQCGVGLESTAFCQPCLDTAHTHAKRLNHKPTILSVPSDFTIMAEHCPVPRLYMELFAVVCIETSHYVAFVKAGSGHEAPWCFFDSMADRKGEQNGYNIPEIVLVEDISVWLSEEGVRALHEAAPSDRMLPEHAKRLLCDAYMCMYQSPDVSMYR